MLVSMNKTSIVNPDPPTWDKVGISRGNVGDLRPYSSPRGQGLDSFGILSIPRVGAKGGDLL